MATKMLGGKNIEVTEEGYLINPDDWSKEVAIDIAKEEGLELTETHFKILDYLRSKFKAGETLTIRAINKSGIVDVKTFYQLFPGAPLRLSMKIAGLPKPTSCV
ncbi:MAG: TusE/DsrC/DsvC family sulfur relay protein [Bacteroidales bacterium]|nr:TusE/DsrC/DsvC family sulfur relay protein [Bacteroidales bacterium]